MKKLQFDVSDLCVESFEAVAEPPSGGTVAAHNLTQAGCHTQATCHQFTCDHTCEPDDLSCNNQNTCYGGTCPDSYYPTCIPLCQTGDLC